MDPLLKKLQFKGSKEILIINSPKEFEKELKRFREEATVLEIKEKHKKYEFILVFAQNQEEIVQNADLVKSLVKNGVLWFAYPKKSSKKYKSDISRDEGWKPLKNQLFEGVRLIAIDTDWFALRFRHINGIKSFSKE